MPSKILAELPRIYEWKEKTIELRKVVADLVQEEFRRNNRYGTSSKVEDEENISLFEKGKKGKGKKTQRKPESIQNNVKKKYLSKIKCFHFYEYGYYAIKWSHKKSTKKP